MKGTVDLVYDLRKIYSSDTKKTLDEEISSIKADIRYLKEEILSIKQSVSDVLYQQASVRKVTDKCVDGDCVQSNSV